jgi:carboxymethylenebutenolidase
MGETIKVKSREGGEFDCYLARPAATKEPMPAIVLAGAIHGVDADLRALADLFASHGVLAAAPDLFWRTVPGPLPRSDARARERIQPREEKIKIGEADMADTLAMLQGLPDFNGRAAAIGFCFGGPYAIIGPKRLGYAAGIACHGTNLIAYIDALEGLSAPLCIVWGDDDHAAPPEVLAAYRAVAARMENVEVHVFPGVKHGYMMPMAGDAFDAKTREFSIARALAILDGLRGGGERLRRAS